MTGRGWRLVAMAAACCVMTAPASASAQTAPPAAAETLPMLQKYPAVGVYGFAPALRPGGSSIKGAPEPSMLRRAEPLGDLVDWLPETDPSVALFKKMPWLSGGVSVVIAIDAEGRGGACRIEHKYGEERLFEGLCDRVSARVRMVPAIDAAGVRLADQFVYYVSFAPRFQPPEKVVDLAAPSPSPPPPFSWPPSSDYGVVSVTGLDLLKGGPTAPEAGAAPWTGIVYDPGDARMPCRVIASSGDAGFDKKACKAAAKGTYDVSRAKTVYQRRIALQFVGQMGKPRALLPVAGANKPPVPTPESLSAVQAATSGLGAEALAKLRLRVVVDIQGRPTQCMIIDSTGSDAGNVKACEAVRALGRFTPTWDVFGRPREGFLYGWKLAPAAGG